MTLHRLVPWLAFAALAAACSGGGDSAGPTDPPVAPSNGRLSAVQPGQLTPYVQQRLRQRTSGGTSGAVPGDAMSPAVSGASTDTTLSRSQLLEPGVDETHLLRTDGTHLYTLVPQGAEGARLSVHRRQGDGSAPRIAALTLPADPGATLDADGLMPSEDGRTLAVVTQKWSGTPATCPPNAACVAVFWTAPSVSLQRVDVSNPAAPVAGTRLVIDGALVDTRRIGDRLIVVTRHRPVFAAETLPAGTDAAAREALIRATTAADALPRVRVDGGPAQPLMDETDCWLQTDNGSSAIEFTAITVVDLQSPTFARNSRCFAGGAEAVSVTTASLYVATTRTAVPAGGLTTWPAQTQTDIHKFVFDGPAVAYRASGSVDGHLGWDAPRKPLRLSEHAGHLRVLTFTGTTGWGMLSDASSAMPASPATLTVLREDTATATLATVATLPNARRPAAIGKPGEQVHGVRFVGDRGYVVTFRRTDPLYVLDLANPADPRIAGELEVTGVSDHLLPLSDGLLFGVGREADAAGLVTALKFALFDVRDPAAPRVLAERTLGGAWSALALDLSRQAVDVAFAGPVARIALPVSLAGPEQPQYRIGLARFEVDTAAGTLAMPPMLAERDGDLVADWWLDRSVQLDGRVYHLARGELTGYAW